jgi:hypothetical protein
MRRVEHFTLAMSLALVLGGCSSSTGPTQPTGAVGVSGTITSRIDGSLVDGSTIECSGPSHSTVSVTKGHYAVAGLAAGSYQVNIKGPAQVDHSSWIDLPASDFGCIVDVLVLRTCPTC